MEEVESHMKMGLTSHILPVIFKMRVGPYSRIIQ